MKVSKQVLTLMVALAAGTAAAGSAGTSAGKSITNTATASYDDPTAPGTPLTKNSNTVTTNLNAVTGFDIVYKDGSVDDTSASTPPATYDKANVLAGATVATPYTVVNNSNIDGYLINIAPDTTGSGTTLLPANVKYYLASDTTFQTPITSVTLANGAQVDIVQVITIPAGAAAGEKYSASPKGTAPAGTTTAVAGTSVAVAYAVYNEATNQNTAGTPPTNGDLQYTRATIFTPLLTETPTAPTTSTVTPPTAPTAGPPATPGTPGTPNNPVSPPGTPAGTGDPSQPGSVDPTTPGTAVVVDVAGNNQTAFPQNGVTTVTFGNQVNNASSLPDTVKLFPTDASGLPLTTATNNNNGTFTLADGTIVKFLSSTGAALPLVTGLDGKQYPTVTAPNGGTVAYRTEVSNFPVSATDPVGTTVLVGISSGNKGTAVKADATTTDRILPPGLQFGDASGANPDGSLVGPGGNAQKVDPSAALSSAPVTDAGVNTDRTAVFPMIIKNTGEYNDTYTLLTSTVTFKNADGTPTPVKVRYVDATGAALPTNAAGDYFTPVVSANTTLTVYAVVDVPATAAATNGTLSGTNPNYAFVQKATANYSGAVITDSVSDQIQVGTFGSLAVDKYSRVNAVIDASFIGTAGAKNDKTANPKDTVNYAIVAKNNYNTPVKNFILKDFNGAGTNAYTFSDFVSASVNSLTASGFAASAVAYFSTDGGTNWATAVTAANVTPANGVWVYVDTDGTLGANNAPTAGDVVPAGASIQLNISTKIK